MLAFCVYVIDLYFFEVLLTYDNCTGLEYLHTGCSPILIHRDIKSSNILISSKLNAKVADFGLTKSVSEDDDPNEIMTFVKGTAGYLDPE